MEEKYMQKFLENVNNNHLEGMEEHLYYYNQGLEIGKEEAKIEIAINLFHLKIDKTTIAKVTDISLETLEQLLY